MKRTIHLPEVDDIPITVSEVSEVFFRFASTETLALLRILEENRTTMEQEAETE